MDYEKGERFVLIVLAIMLFIGALTLYVMRSKGAHKRIEITQDMRRMLSNKRKVNINTATEAELMSISGVGNVLASRIIEYRKTHGEFYAENGLLNIKGVGKNKLNKISQYIVFK